MIIRVKEKERNEQEKEENAEKSKGLGDSLLDHDSSVEVGYGLCYLIVNSK